MVGAAGFEPATLCLEGRCSIQLSYAPTGRTSPILAEFRRISAQKSHASAPNLGRQLQNHILQKV